MKKRILAFCVFVLSIAGAMFALSSCKDEIENAAQEILCEAPENIAFDGNYITWTKSSGALYYNVSINGATAVRSNSTSYAYASTENFDVTVTAVFSETEKSTSISFKPLTAISEVFVSNDGQISWSSVGGANAYAVSINGMENVVTDTQYTTLAEGSNRVKVKPIVQGDNSFYSFWSEEENIYIYSAPTNVKYDGTTITWAGNSTSYQVGINGALNTVTGNSYTYNADGKDFIVEVIALGNHSTTYDSKGAEEEYKYLAPVPSLTVEEGILKWNPIENAEGYQVKIDGLVQRNPVTEAEYTGLVTGKSLEVSVMPYNNSGNYFSSWSAVKNVYILDTPVPTWNNDLELDGEANNNYTWNAVNAAEGYTVRLTKNGTLVDEYDFSSVQRAFANAYSEVAVYTIQVKANAQSGSSDNYDSKYSTPITVERLAAPKQASNDFIVSQKDNLAAGFTVNFTPTSGAKEYQLYKDGVLLAGKKTTGNALTDTNVADAANLERQEYTYMVRSMGEVKTVSGQKYVTLPCLTSEALSFNITVQATPQHLTMSGFVLSWDAISGSNGYAVAYAGNTYNSATENYNLSTLKAGTYSVTVCAKGDGASTLASSYSTAAEIQRLSAPTDIKISAASNGTLEWKDVSNATGYQAFLDLSETALDENAYENMYQFITTEGSTLSMVAVANKYNDLGTLYYMTSEASPTQQFIRLAAPTFPEGAISNSVELLWNMPSNINKAEYTPSYRVYSAIGEQIGGGNHNSTSFNIEYLEGGGTYNFYVKAIGNDTRYLDSEYSVVKTVHKLATPVLDIQNGQYVWNGIANASSYYLEIDGKKVSDEYHVSGNVYSYTPRFTSAGDHTVVLKAKGDGINNVDSAAYNYTQKAVILAKPTITYGYSDSSVVANGSITVQIEVPSAYCLKYQYEIAGETVADSSLTYTKAITNTGEYVIRVKALGGNFDAQDVYYIDSEYAGGNSGYVIRLLGTPSTSSFSINSDGVIKWGAISGAFGYDYEISYNGGEFEEITHVGYPNLQPITGYKQYQSITIRVRASGSTDGTTVTSAWVEWTWTNAG